MKQRLRGIIGALNLELALLGCSPDSAAPAPAARVETKGGTE
jgi:hypothetical protein